MRTSRPVQCSMEINALKWTSLGEKHEKVSGILHHSVDCRIWWMAGVLFIGCVGICTFAREWKAATSVRPDNFIAECFGGFTPTKHEISSACQRRNFSG